MISGAKVPGSAVRQDGRSASLTAPNGLAQRLLLRAVLSDARTTPTQLEHAEAAANGSALGDSIEAGAIAATLLGVSGEELQVGSVKGNVGHTESASGMMGLVKLLLHIVHACTAPNAQLLILAEPVAMALQNATRTCTLPTQLAAANHRGGTASSFGLGGTIASVLVQAAAQSVGMARNYIHATLVYARRAFSWQSPLRVHLVRRGAISGLELCEQPAFVSPLATGELELQVRAVGLNFRDILNVLGQLPARFLTAPGDDCSGTVTAAGERTSHVRRGHELFGVANGCLSTFVRTRTDMRLLVHRPAHTTAEEACTLPGTWSTVHVLIRRGCHRTCKRLLLHAATGGVGLVSVTYLHWLSARVIATAGRAGKHVILGSLGVSSSCSSRQGAAFTYGVSSQLATARLHGACNSLSNDFTSASLAGKFIPAGKPY